MLNFLEPEIKSEAKVNNDYDPVEIVYEIGEGVEELNTELIRADILTKAVLSLEKSIDLDEQIEANNLANRATVSYGIEALDITATFLGYPVDVESIAAGIEDNDQEKPAEEKKSLLEKIKKAAKTTWKRIIEFLEEIINKVKEFFQSKAVENAENKLEKAADSVKKALNGDNKKPECKDKNKAETHKEAVARLFPGFVYANGIKSDRDFITLLECLTDIGPLEALKELVDNLDKDTLEVVKVLKEVGKSNKEIKEKVAKIGLDYIRKFKITKFKQHKVKEELIKKFDKDIMEMVEKKLNGVKADELEHATLFKEAKIKDGKLELSVVVFYKNKHAESVISKALETVEDDKAVSKFLDKMKETLGYENISILTDIKLSEIAKNIEPFSAKELETVKEELANFKNKGGKYLKDIEERNNKLKEGINKVADMLKELDDKNTDKLTTFITKMIMTASDIVKTESGKVIRPITGVITAIIKLTENCAVAEEKVKNPFK